MTLEYEIPGGETLVLEHLLLDVNGTLTDQGELIEGVSERLKRLQDDLAIRLLSADSRGTLDDLATNLELGSQRVSSGSEKRAWPKNKRGAPRRAAGFAPALGGDGRRNASGLGKISPSNDEAVQSPI